MKENKIGLVILNLISTCKDTCISAIVIGLYNIVFIIYNYLIPELPASICSRSQDTETIKGTAITDSFIVGGVT